MPANCPSCGREIKHRDRFCDGCGAFLDWEQGASPDSQLIPEVKPEAEEQRAGVQLQLSTDLIRVAPGNAESVTFIVRNLGTQVEEFRCAVAGPDWITAGPAGHVGLPRSGCHRHPAGGPAAPAQLGGGRHAVPADRHLDGARQHFR